MAAAKYWQGATPKHCDICKSPIDNVFIDGAIITGAWANMDEKCYNVFGRGLGTGLGQKYEKQVDGRWLKVEG
jgi:hypothetical protein